MAVTLEAMARKSPLITFVMEPSLIERIDDFRFANRFGSRAAAMKYLMEWALNIADSGTEAMDHFRPQRFLGTAPPPG